MQEKVNQLTKCFKNCSWYCGFPPKTFLFNPLPIIEESLQPKQTFWNNTLMVTFLRSPKKNGPFIVFSFVGSGKEANTLCSVL